MLTLSDQAYLPIKPEPSHFPSPLGLHPSVAVKVVPIWVDEDRYHP